MLKQQGRINIQEVDERLQGLHERLDGVRGEVLRCADEQEHARVLEEQNQATRDYFRYFFGEVAVGNLTRKRR